MVDAADGEMPQMFGPEKEPCVDGESQQHSPTLMDPVSKVLGDDDLLRELIVRVGLPTTLVHAALVCKRWLEHASDPLFLCRFRKLHPPRLLGYYIIQESIDSGEPSTRFVPMLPQIPELAGIIRCIESYSFGDQEILDCRNGSVFTRRCRHGCRTLHAVHRPMCPERSLYPVPLLPRVPERTTLLFSAILSKQEGGRLSYLFLQGEVAKERAEYETGLRIAAAMLQDLADFVTHTTTRVYMLQDGEWRMLASVICQLPILSMKVAPVLVGSKIYIWTNFCDEVMVMDLTASIFTRIPLPPGVDHDDSVAMFSRADDDSGVYLIRAKEFQLRIWLYKEDNWLLVDTICLQEMRPYLEMFDQHMDSSDDCDGLTTDVQICRVGEDCQFVFLQMGRWIFYLDIKSRKLRKVIDFDDHTFDDQGFVTIHPCMMIWPPTFPALKEDPARTDDVSAASRFRDFNIDSSESISLNELKRKEPELEMETPLSRKLPKTAAQNGDGQSSSQSNCFGSRSRKSNKSNKREKLDYNLLRQRKSK